MKNKCLKKLGRRRGKQGEGKERGAFRGTGGEEGERNRREEKEKGRKGRKGRICRGKSDKRRVLNVTEDKERLLLVKKRKGMKREIEERRLFECVGR